MNVSPISFASSASFNDLISKPQAYHQKETPVASSAMYNPAQPKKSNHKFAKFLVAAAAIAGALALGAKYNVFKSDKITNETLKKGLGYCQQAGEKVLQGVAFVKDKAMAFISGLGKKAENVTAGVENTAPASATVADKVGEVIQTTGEKIEQAAEKIVDSAAK